LIRYREMYGCERDPVTNQLKHNVGVRTPAAELAQEAWDISVAEGCKDMVADPSIWTKVKITEADKSIAEVFEAVGWNMIRGVNDRLSGLARVHDYLKGMASDGRPLMLISEVCHAWIRTIPVLVVDEKRPEDLDTTGEDHCYDETRYAVMSQFATIQYIEHRPLEIRGEFVDEEQNAKYNYLTGKLE